MNEKRMNSNFIFWLWLIFLMSVISLQIKSREKLLIASFFLFLFLVCEYIGYFHLGGYFAMVCGFLLLLAVVAKAGENADIFGLIFIFLLLAAFQFNIGINIWILWFQYSIVTIYFLILFLPSGRRYFSGLIKYNINEWLLGRLQIVFICIFLIYANFLIYNGKLLE